MVWQANGNSISYLAIVRPFSQPSKLRTPDLLRQQQLVNALCEPEYLSRSSKVEETHISWVLLSGHDVYKIKEAVDLGFLDFYTLELRRYYCADELLLNRRRAPMWLRYSLMKIDGGRSTQALHEAWTVACRWVSIREISSFNTTPSSKTAQPFCDAVHH